MLSDHRGTSSWGPSKEAKKYRENLQSMISEGKVRDAIATDIWDVKNVTGQKYNAALQEMLKYGKKEGIIPIKGKKQEMFDEGLFGRVEERIVLRF